MKHSVASNRAGRWSSGWLPSRTLMTALGLMSVCILTAPADAWAYRHTGAHPDVCNEPFEWYLSDSPDTPDFAVEVISEAFDDWMAILPCDATHTFMGVREGHNAGFTFDNVNTLYFGDPADESGAGVTAQTLARGDGTTCHQWAGDTYVITTDADLVFNDDINWLTTEEATHPDCEDGYELKSLVMHEIGHMLGMGHSCEEGDPCSDPIQAEALMYWSNSGSCSGERELNEDDIDGFIALWSGSIEVDSPFWISGTAPFEYCLSVSPDVAHENEEGRMDTVVNVSWGDDSLRVYENETRCHTYDTPGEYTIEIDWTTELIDHPGHPNSGSESYEAFVFADDVPGTGGSGDGEDGPSGGEDADDGPSGGEDGDDGPSGGEDGDDEASSDKGGGGCATTSHPSSPWGLLAFLIMIRIRRPRTELHHVRDGDMSLRESGLNSPHRH
jgi:hypothetical protein